MSDKLQQHKELLAQLNERFEALVSDNTTSHGEELMALAKQANVARQNLLATLETVEEAELANDFTRFSFRARKESLK